MNRRRNVLAVTRAVAATLALSVALAGIPAAGQEVSGQAATTPSPLRQSIDRALAPGGPAAHDAVLSVDERADVARRAGRLRADPVAGQAAGGGGKFKTIVTLVGIAASVWGTWYMIQYMKKQQEREQGGVRP